ncbi:TetR family transcriptional regulator [Paeniglutamicibacter antarcticus]|uniref:TetR family transcriptional regulator n=1 Tax=Arthrobacter terrae TaxID=2935737 RepID=A0A931CN71_9MICC|nr:TetR family transcriptional regulator [Arthrobacter terrae]MBG0739265.1 TetR family transcriptional regulator [Arthrobacter terrae]
MTADAPRPGRRRGTGNSRATILDSARKLFAEQGYDATSMRAIARDAGVDSALVHHYFRDKDELFVSCIELPADPESVLAAVARTVPEVRGETLLRAVLGLWESSAQPALIALLRGAVSSAPNAELLRQVLTKRIIAALLTDLAGNAADRQLRGALAASALIGLLMTRYILKLEPLVSASGEEVISLLAPTLQHYLTGNFPRSPSPA